MKKTRRKALGQHFLTSRAVLKKIIGAIAPRKDELIIEIGAGKGALTYPLSDLCARIIAIEKDRTMVLLLSSQKKDNLVVLEQDVLRLNWRDLLAKQEGFPAPVKLVGNLPYSISSPILFKVLEEKDLFSECIFLLQKEVAERISARPGSKNYAPLSILFQMDFEVRRCLTIAPGAFSPPPRVQSALISLKRRTCPLFPMSNPDHFRRFLRAAFAQRRKTLLNNLKSFSAPLSLVKDTLKELSLKDKARAEQLSIAQLVALFERLTAGPSNPPPH